MGFPQRIKGLPGSKRRTAAEHRPLRKPSPPKSNVVCGDVEGVKSAGDQSGRAVGKAGRRKKKSWLEAKLRLEIRDVNERLATTQAELVELRRRYEARLAEMENQLASGPAPFGDEFALEDAKESVRDFTAKIFDDGGAFRLDHDIDDPSDRYFVVNVAVAGALDELMKKEETWHLAAARLPANLRCRFRLSLDVVE